MSEKTTSRVVPGGVSSDEAPVYFEKPVRLLPGLIRKHVTIRNGEAGLLLERGEIVRPLKVGRQGIGWRFWGWGSQGTVARLRSDSFTLPLRFYRLGEGNKESLDAFTQAVVAVEDPAKFYRAAVLGRPSLTARRLGSNIAARAQTRLDLEAASFDAEMLKADPRVGEQFTENRLSQPLSDLFREMGLRLLDGGLYPLKFRSSRETESLQEDAFNLLAEIRGRGDKDWAVLRGRVEQFASRAVEIELASPSEVDAIRAAAGTTIDASSSSAVLETVERVVWRVAGETGERARRLPVKEKARDGSHLLLWLNLLQGSLTWVLVGAIVAAFPAYWFWYRGQGLAWPSYLAGFGVFVGVVRLMLQICSELEKRSRHREEQAENEMTWFKKWQSKDATGVDEVIRHQVATQLESVALPDVQQAAIACQKGGRKEEGEALRQTVEALREIATSIRGAGKASSAFASGGKQGLVRGARLIGFEEETLRLTRTITDLAGQLKSGEPAKAQENQARLNDTVDALRRHFYMRESVIEGAPWEPAAATAP